MGVCSLACLSPSQSPWLRSASVVPSLPATIAAAHGLCSASCVAVPLSLTWLEDIMGIWGLRSYGPGEEEPQLLHS